MLDFPMVPTPFEDEDLLGFLSRCANVNALTVAELVKRSAQPPRLIRGPGFSN